jgi:hypothetical protein
MDCILFSVSVLSIQSFVCFRLEMKHCIRLFLLLIPSLISLGLLGVAFSTNWWTIALEKVIV